MTTKILDIYKVKKTKNKIKWATKIYKLITNYILKYSKQVPGLVAMYRHGTLSSIPEIRVKAVLWSSPSPTLARACAFTLDAEAYKYITKPHPFNYTHQWNSGRTGWIGGFLLPHCLFLLVLLPLGITTLQTVKLHPHLFLFPTCILRLLER